MKEVVKSKEMTAEDLIELLQYFVENGVSVWLDGGWGVDALLGEQTRSHADMDIFISEEDLLKARNLLKKRGYKDIPRNDTRPWNFVLGDDKGHEVDFHVVTFDGKGNILYGPDGKDAVFSVSAFSGIGSVNGYQVRCISVEQIVKWHTGYTLDENDYHDMYALQKKFGIELPPEYQK